MRELFRDTLEIKGVTGVMLLNYEGEPVYQEFNSPHSRELKEKKLGCPYSRFESYSGSRGCF